LAGCTANVCLLSPEHVFVANAGDSRSVACCRGHPVPLSYDHKPDDRAEYRRIRKAGGFVHNGRINHTLNMSRSLGDL
jgi:serine/threonine protein phosphatase PrpC